MKSSSQEPESNRGPRQMVILALLNNFASGEIAVKQYLTGRDRIRLTDLLRQKRNTAVAVFLFCKKMPHEIELVKLAISRGI